EIQWARYTFEASTVEAHFEMFKTWEGEAMRLLDLGLVLPGYDAVIKTSHLFNVLDARGAISVSERGGYLGRVRTLARSAAVEYVKQREALGFPLITDETERAKWLKGPEDAPATDAAPAAPKEK